MTCLVWKLKGCFWRICVTVGRLKLWVFRHVHVVGVASPSVISCHLEIIEISSDMI